MIIGDGLIGSAFSATGHLYEDMVIFARGVSDSNETSVEAFHREERLLLQMLAENKNKLFVYFSTCHVSKKTFIETPYLSHKLKMESHVKKHPEFLIIRLPNVIGAEGNPNNLINLLFKKIYLNERVDIWENTRRNIIDNEDVAAIVNKLLKAKISNRTVTVASTVNYSIEEIVNEISDFTNSKPERRKIEKSPNEDIYPSGIVRKIISEIDLDMDQRYFRRILEKYFKKWKKDVDG